MKEKYTLQILKYAAHVVSRISKVVQFHFHNYQINQSATLQQRQANQLILILSPKKSIAICEKFVCFCK